MSRAGIVVVGGANVDAKVQTLARAVPGTSNPGRTAQAWGGVGRNVAENLARLGLPVALLSAVGADVAGEALLAGTAAAGVDVGGVLRISGETTGSYTAVLGDTGELLIGVAAMGVLEHLTPAALDAERDRLANAAWLVADGNLPPATLRRLLALGAELGVPVACEPVSVPKAARLREALAAGLSPALVTPNRAELAALTGQEEHGLDVAGACADLHAQGVETVWVRLGADGSLLSTPDDSWALAALPAAVVDVTGAGDAMLAAFLAARLAGRPLPEAGREAHAAAALTIESAQTVRPDLSPALISARLA